MSTYARSPVDRIVRLVLLGLGLVVVIPPARAAAADAVPAPKPKTGEFTATFTERSPLTAPKVVAQRTGQKTLEPPDYGLAAEPFLVWVPDDYAPAQPHGLLVLLNYKATGGPPTPVLPLLKERNLIFVAPQAAGPSAWVRAGLAVDAVHNLRKQYAVDDTRVFLLDFDRGNGTSAGGGQVAITAFGDVFTGSFHFDGLLPWKPIRAGNGGRYPARVAPPVPQYAGPGKARPVVLAHPQLDEYRALSDKFAQQEGFRLVKTMTVTAEQAHYPVYTTDWLPQVIKFWDDNRPKPPAGRPGAARPATKPAAAPAARPGGGLVR